MGWTIMLRDAETGATRKGQTYARLDTAQAVAQGISAGGRTVAVVARSSGEYLYAPGYVVEVLS
jgi:hypothetical protein